MEMDSTTFSFAFVVEFVEYARLFVGGSESLLLFSLLKFFIIFLMFVEGELLFGNSFELRRWGKFLGGCLSAECLLNGLFKLLYLIYFCG